MVSIFYAYSRYASGPIVADPGSASGDTLPALSRTSFTFRTPNINQKIEQLFYCPVVQAPLPGDLHKLSGKRFSLCYSQALKKCLVLVNNIQKTVYRFMVVVYVWQCTCIRSLEVIAGVRT